MKWVWPLKIFVCPNMLKRWTLLNKEKKKNIQGIRWRERKKKDQLSTAILWLSPSRYVRTEWQKFWKDLVVSWITDGKLRWPSKVKVCTATQCSEWVLLCPLLLSVGIHKEHPSHWLQLISMNRKAVFVVTFTAWILTTSFSALIKM